MCGTAAWNPPVIIAGLPRSGTTHLHNLMAADSAFRTLPYWESLEPFPRRWEQGVVPDPRIERAAQSLWFANTAMPLFPVMHEMTDDHAHEEIQLLAVDFSTMFFETLGDVPDWVAYYRSHSQVPHYRFLRLMLAALQAQRGEGRWLLKSPQHLEQLSVLAEVFPDATVVLTHRELVDVVVSMATMIAYTARMHVDPVEPEAIGRRWADRLEVMLATCVADRDVLAPESSCDVRFSDFMGDEIATVEAIYELAGAELTADGRAQLVAYLDGHPRGRLGRIEYSASDVGLDRDELFADSMPTGHGSSSTECPALSRSNRRGGSRPPSSCGAKP